MVERKPREAARLRPGVRDAGIVAVQGIAGEDKGNLRKSFIYLCSRPICQAGSWVCGSG